jgi:hypothetical protein
MMKLKLSVLLVAGCLVSAASCAAEVQTAQSDYRYTVKAGDNLSVFAQTVLDNPKRWSEVAKYNHLKNPNVINPGQVLLVQMPWLKNQPAQAKIESLSGAVTLNGAPAKVGDMIATGAKLATPAGASLRMSLADGSTLNMLEKTQLEATALERKPQGNFYNSVFRLVTGRIDALKQKYPEGQAPLRIQAMHATIGVRGTHFRMGQEGENTMAEIENGLVSFGDDAKGAPIALAAAQGSVGDGVHNPMMIPLLPAPQMPVMPNNFDPSNISFVMPDQIGAKGYRGEVANDEKFMMIVAPVSSDTPAIKLASLTEGRYWLRLRAVDEHGLQGLESAVALQIKNLPPPRPIELKPTAISFVGDRMQVNWEGEPGLTYECHVASVPEFTHPLVNVILKDHSITIPSPEAGQYWMRVRSINAEGQQSDWSEVMNFKVK